MLNVRAVVLAASLILGGVALGAPSKQPSPDPPKAASQPQGNASENQAQTKADQRATAAQPAVIELLKAPVIRVEATDKTEKHNDYASHEWWLVYLTAVLALTTVALAVYTALLWRATRKLVGDAKASSEKQLRAYVSVTPSFMWNFDRTTLVAIKCQLNNHGQTPAHDFFIESAGVSVWPDPLPDGWEFPEPHKGVRPKNVIFPGSNRLITPYSDRPFTQQEIDDSIFVGRGKRIYVFGTIKYKDAFGFDRWTTFCQSVEPGEKLQHVATMGTVKDGDLTFTTSNQHNDYT